MQDYNEIIMEKFGYTVPLAGVNTAPWWWRRHPFIRR